MQICQQSNITTIVQTEFRISLEHDTSSVVEEDLPSLTEDLKIYCASTEDLLFVFWSYCFGQKHIVL